MNYLPYSRTQESLRNLGETLRNMAIQKTQTESFKIGERLKLAELGLRGAELESQTKLGTLSTLARLKSEESQQKYYDWQIKEAESQKEARRIKAIQEAEENKIYPTFGAGLQEMWTQSGLPPENQEKLLRMYSDASPVAESIINRPNVTKKEIHTVLNKLDEIVRERPEEIRKIREGEAKTDEERINKYRTNVINYTDERLRLVGLKEMLNTKDTVDNELTEAGAQSGINIFFGKAGDTIDPTARKRYQTEIDKTIGFYDDLIKNTQSRIKPYEIKTEIIPELEREWPASQYPGRKMKDKSGLLFESTNGQWEYIGTEEEIPKEQIPLPDIGR